MLIKVRQFLTKSQQNPVPFRTMRIQEIKRETEKAVLVRLQGAALPQSECVHCGREITHPQSLHFGIGSTCIKKYPHLLEIVDYNDIESSYKKLQEEMPKTTWEGWLPKGYIEMIPEEPTSWKIQFIYDRDGLGNFTTYNVTTSDPAKVEEIKAKADQIIYIQEVFV